MSSKQSIRRQRAKMIRAAEQDGRMIEFDASTIDWVKAEGASVDGGGDKIPKFKMTAYTGGPMMVGYYSSPVVVDLAGMKAQSLSIPILMAHDPLSIVGHAEEIDISESAVKLSGVVSGTGDAAKEVVGNSKNGFPWKASIGARPDKLEFVGEGVATKVNGKTFTGPLFVARKSTLGEVSFVSIGADSKTTVKVAASANLTINKKENEAMNFEQWVQALGLDFKELRDDQKAKLQTKYDAEIKAAAVKTGGDIKAAEVKIELPKFDINAIALVYEQQIITVQAKATEYIGKIEGTKLAEIQAKASKTAIELKAKALNEKWPEARLEVELVKATALYEVDLIRAERPKGPAIHSSTRDQSPQVIEAAFCQTAGLQTATLEKTYKPEVLEAADKMRGFGLKQLLLHYAVQGGYTGNTWINNGNLREVLRAAFSVHSLTTLLSTAGNKFLLEGFNSIPQMWRQVAGVRSLNDFKTHTGYRLTANLEYEEVGPGGEIHHGTVGQESYTMNVLTFGKMLSFTRQDMINDDLGALNAIRDRLGMGAAVKMENLFWTVFLTASNTGTFWSAAHGNLVTSSALAEAGLNTAVKAFRDMEGPDGNMMNMEPEILLVPTALEATARKLYASQEVRDTTATTKFLTTNIYQNRFKPIAVPHLGNSSYTGYSATTYYLLANPAVMACAVMCFLNGQESPTIESAEADFDTLGIQFRGYHDFYPAMTEYRPTVKAQA